MRKGTIALIGMILTLVFIIIGFIGPWYILSMNSVYGNVEASIGLTSMQVKVNGVNIPYEQFSGDKGPIDTTMYITIGALVMAILSLIGILDFSLNFGNPKTMKMVGLIFGILCFIMALIAPVYFMTSFNSESFGNVGFWNQYGGPGYAWYLMIVTAIIALVVSIMLMIYKEKKEMPIQEQTPGP
jgi:magnesium-transporting ATPase (P-type)